LVGEILGLMRQYFFDHLNEAMQMLKQEQRLVRRTKVRKKAKLGAGRG
jgi:hypothetical protein